MAGLDDCSAAASAKWSNGLGALSSSTFLVYKYIARACVCVNACVRVRAYDDVARLCNCPSWNRPTDRIRLFYFIANAAPTIPTYFFLFTNPVHGNAQCQQIVFLPFSTQLCVYILPYLVESLSESATYTDSVQSRPRFWNSLRWLRKRWSEYRGAHLREQFFHYELIMAKRLGLMV